MTYLYANLLGCCMKHTRHPHQRCQSVGLTTTGCESRQAPGLHLQHYLCWRSMVSAMRQPTSLLCARAELQLSREQYGGSSSAPFADQSTLIKAYTGPATSQG